MEVLERGPGERSGGVVKVHDPETPNVVRVFEMQNDYSHRQAAKYF